MHKWDSIKWCSGGQASLCLLILGLLPFQCERSCCDERACTHLATKSTRPVLCLPFFWLDLQVFLWVIGWPSSCAPDPVYCPSSWWKGIISIPSLMSCSLQQTPVLIFSIVKHISWPYNHLPAFSSPCYRKFLKRIFSIHSLQFLLVFSKIILRLGFHSVLVNSGCHNEVPVTGWLKHRTLFSQGSGVWTSQVKVLADLVPGEGSLPGYSLCPQMHPTVITRALPLWPTPQRLIS